MGGHDEGIACSFSFPHGTCYNQMSLQGVGIPVLARYRGTGGWYVNAQLWVSFSAHCKPWFSRFAAEQVEFYGRYSGKIVEVLEVEDDDGNVEKRYSINYDDGAEEKDAPRGMIKVSFEVDRVGFSMSLRGCLLISQITAAQDIVIICCIVEEPSTSRSTRHSRC